MNTYHYAAQQIAVGRDPLPGLDADIAKVQDAIVSVDPNDVDEVAALEARLRRLVDARNEVQQVLETHRGRQAQGTVNWAAIASDQWQLGYRPQDNSQLLASAPADVYFDRAVAPLDQLQDRSRAVAAVDSESSGSLTSVTDAETSYDSSDLRLSASGSYPEPPPPLPSDVDYVGLVQAIAKDIDDIDLAKADRSDPVQAARVQAYGTAVQSVRNFEDPVAQLDDVAFLYAQQAAVAEAHGAVRDRIAELVEQYRRAPPPVALYDEAKAAERQAAVRRQVLAAADQLRVAHPSPASPSPALDYVAPPPPSGLPTVNAADATAKLTILDNDPTRFVGFSPSARAPIVRVTPAEAANLRGGQLGLEVIDATTRSPYPGGFVVRPNLANDEIARPFEQAGTLDNPGLARSLAIGPAPPPDEAIPRWHRRSI